MYQSLAFVIPILSLLGVQLRILPVNPNTILLPPTTLQISRHILPPLHPLIQLKHLPIRPALPHPSHRHWERKADPIHTLPKHQIRIRQLPPIKPLPASARLALQHALKVVEELRQPVGNVVGGLSFRFLLLLLVVRGRGDGVVRVVRFVAEPVQGCERELVDVVDGVLVACGAREAELRREVEEDVGRLAEEEVAVPERWWCERGWVCRVSFVLVGYEGCEGAHAILSVLVAGVGVGGLGRFETEADVFAATGDGGPVWIVKFGLVLHVQGV